MKALAEIQVIPIGVGISVRKEVQRAHAVIRSSGLKVELHAYGTNVEGDLDTILSTIKQIHAALHAGGTQRLSTAIKLGTRTDKETNLEEKLFDTQSS